VDQLASLGWLDFSSAHINASAGHVQEVHPLVLRFFEEGMDPSAISALRR
jgi:hypothetical protein